MKNLLFIVLIFIFGCQSGEKNEVIYKYKIEYTINTIVSGWYKTNEYKIENGYYLFLCGKDSIKLKENLVTIIETNNNFININ